MLGRGGGGENRGPTCSKVVSPQNTPEERAKTGRYGTECDPAKAVGTSLRF